VINRIDKCHRLDEPFPVRLWVAFPRAATAQPWELATIPGPAPVALVFETLNVPAVLGEESVVGAPAEFAWPSLKLPPVAA
jgi:hypothetical protein